MTGSATTENVPTNTTTNTNTNTTDDAGSPTGVLGGRERIDAIDAELIELIRRRVAVSTEIQAARIADGGRRLDLSRETEIIGRYNRSAASQWRRSNSATDRSEHRPSVTHRRCVRVRLGAEA